MSINEVTPTAQVEPSLNRIENPPSEQAEPTCVDPALFDEKQRLPLPTNPQPTTESTPDAEQRLRQAARILANGATRAALKKRAEEPLQAAPKQRKASTNAVSENHTSDAKIAETVR